MHDDVIALTTERHCQLQLPPELHTDLLDGGNTPKWPGAFWREGFRVKSFTR